MKDFELRVGWKAASAVCHLIMSDMFFQFSFCLFYDFPSLMMIESNVPACNSFFFLAGLLCKCSNDHCCWLFKRIRGIHVQLFCKFTLLDKHLNSYWGCNWGISWFVMLIQEDVTPTRVIEIVEVLRRGETPPVSYCFLILELFAFSWKC